MPLCMGHVFVHQQRHKNCTSFTIHSSTLNAALASARTALKCSVNVLSSMTLSIPLRQPEVERERGSPIALQRVSSNLKGCPGVEPSAQAASCTGRVLKAYKAATRILHMRDLIICGGVPRIPLPAPLPYRPVWGFCHRSPPEGLSRKGAQTTATLHKPSTPPPG